MDMRMRMLLLVSTVAVLASPAVATPLHHKLNENLKHILRLVDKYNDTLAQEFFVEDVSGLAQGKNHCDDKFFCKAHEVLLKHTATSKSKQQGEDEIVRNLKIFVDERNLNCTELIMDLTPTGVTKPISVLVGHLTNCIKSRNLNGHP